MEKINILFLYSAKGFGGMVQNLSLVVQNLNFQRFRLHVVALGNAGDGDAGLKVRDDTARLWRIDERNVFDLNAIQKIRSLIKEENIYVLSCHGYKADLYGFLLVRVFGCAVRRVTMTHGWVTPGWKMQLYYLLDKLVMRDFDKVILVEAGMAAQLGPFFPKRKLITIENGVDTEYFRSRVHDQEGSRSEVLGGRKVLGFIGRLSPEKGVRTILLALEKVVKIYPNTHLRIVGAGPEEARLRNDVVELRLEKNVSFCGYRPDTRKEYGAIDIYISASVREGLSNTILEAQASGIPCIVSNIPGNRRIVTDSVNGLVFQPGDPGDLAGKICWMFEHSEKVREWGRAGQERMETEFSLKKRVRKLEELYLSLAGQGLGGAQAATR